MPTRLYSKDEIRKIVHLQACARRFLAQRLIKNVIENPSLYLRPSVSSQFNKYVASYSSPIVNQKLAELGDFLWGDRTSENMKQASGESVTFQDEVQLP